MIPLVQVCVVIATLSVVAIAVATVRAMLHADRARSEFTRLTEEIRQWIVEANAFTREARETVASVHDAVAPIRRVVDRFEALGERTATLSAAVLGEVEQPIHTAVAVARGVKTVTAFLFERLSQRFTHGRSATNGGSDGE